MNAYALFFPRSTNMLCPPHYSMFSAREFSNNNNNKHVRNISAFTLLRYFFSQNLTREMDNNYNIFMLNTHASLPFVKRGSILSFVCLCAATSFFIFLLVHAIHFVLIRNNVQSCVRGGAMRFCYYNKFWFFFELLVSFE